MSVYGYVRVSTKQQADDGLSLDAQQRQIEGYAMMQGLHMDQVYVERAVSGWKPFDSRPQGGLLTACLSEGDVIYVQSWTACLDQLGTLWLYLMSLRSRVLVCI